MSRVQFVKRTKTDFLVVHCAATKPSMDIGLREIRQWHRQKGWLDVGYHFIIRRDGAVEAGRDVNVIGAHVQGYNSESVGVCLVGGINDKGEPEANFTPEQYESLSGLLTDLSKQFPHASIVGHRELDPKKACPSFDVQAWLREDRKVAR